MQRGTHLTGRRRFQGQTRVAKRSDVDFRRIYMRRDTFELYAHNEAIRDMRFAEFMKKKKRERELEVMKNSTIFSVYSKLFCIKT